jgi:putative peptidoglycan lipid II flippase
VTKIFLRLVFGGFAGKLLGLVREVQLAALFGAGPVVAANRISLSATLIPVQFFTADALSAGFLPLYIQYRRDNPPMALALYRSVRLLLASMSVLLVVALFVGRGAWLRILGPGLDTDTAGIATAMLEIAALGVPFLVLYSLHTLVALAHDDVRLINLRASVQSLGLIGATLAAYLSGDVTLLAWGFTAPYVLLWCWGTFRVRRCGYLGGDRAALAAPAREDYKVALSMFWRRLRPLLLIPVILQGSIAVERAVGSLLGVEVVAATEYARFVVDSCMALLAAPLGLAGLASFSKMRSDDVAAGLRRLVPPVLFLTVPLSMMLCINSTPIVSLLYARGQFDERAVRTTSLLLLGFGLGIWAHVIGHTLVKVLNARGANLRVAIIMAMTFLTAMILNLSLYRYWGAFTLGAAASIGGLIMLVASTRALGILRFTSGLLAALLPGAAAAAVVGFLLSGPGVMRLAASCVGIIAVWLLYIVVVPQLRNAFMTTIWARLTRASRAQAEQPPERLPQPT